MKKLFFAAALIAGALFSAPSAFAHGYGGYHAGGVHVGVGLGGVQVTVGGGHGGVYYNNHGNNYYRGGHYPYPMPYPMPYPRPYPIPAPIPASITVLVTEYCSPYPYTHYVTAYWDRVRGGYWYYDCSGNYRRAR